MQRSLMLFQNSIHSKATLKAYSYTIDKFIQYFKLKDHDSIISMDVKLLQEMVEDYVMYMKSKDLSRSSISMPINALQLFCDSNDVEIRWKKIRRMIPHQKKRTGRNAYTTEDIATMLSFEPSIRNKALIHFLAASGVRIGAIPLLKMGHLSQVSDDSCMSVTVYEGEPEEYMTFLTPEATAMLKRYHDKRREDGEYLGNESPVFRAQYTIAISKPKPLSIHSAQMMIERILRRTNMRTGFHGKRRNIQLDHGFRKRFNTILKMTDGVNPLLAEKMMGHSISSIPLDETYLAPTTDRLFLEYQKAIPNLTIDTTASKNEQIRKIEKQKTELEKTNEMYKKILKEKQRLEQKYRDKTTRPITDKKLRNQIIDILREHGQI